MVRSPRRRATVAALGALALLTATACDSGTEESSSTVAATQPPSSATAAPDTAAPDTAPPASEAPGETASPAPQPTAAPELEPEPTALPVVVPEALQFTAPLVGGGTFDGAAIAGKPTLFWFWAPT